MKQETGRTSGARATSAVPTLIDERFEVLAELGRGAVSRVYEVRDVVHLAQRALKLANGPGQLRRLRTEFQRLCELRHANVVRAFDFGVDERGLPFYTMELVRGVPIDAHPGRAEPELLATLAMQALEALTLLHARGLVHRDVQPRNLLVSAEGAAATVRLIDLGLTVPTGARSSPAGTLPYMAPEVVRGDAVDGRADLYSLGMVLYEALVPEAAVSTVEDVARGLSERKADPSRDNPLVPSGLSAFVMRLIEPERAARFAGAEEAAEALAKVPGLRVGRGPARAVAERILRVGAVSHRSGLVARVKRRAKELVQRGRGHVLVIEGAAGTGKSPLLREVSMSMNLLGLRVVQVRTGDEPGSPIGALVRAARALDEAAALDPSLVWPIDAASGPGAVSSFLSRAGGALAQALSRRPTALLVDDLQRAESVGIEVLGDLARAARGAPLLLIAAGEPRPDRGELATRLAAEVELATLEPLSAAQVARLAAHRLHGLELPAPALERLVQDSQGMPSLVERTLARLLVDETIQRHGERFVFVGGRYRPVRHSDAEGLVARVADLRSREREVLWAAAVLGDEVEAEAAAEVAGLGPDEALSSLRDLGQRELLNPIEAAARPRYKFPSRAAQAAIYQSVPTGRRRELHDRAAELLARQPQHGQRLEAEVEHLLKGSDDERAIDAAMRAGARATAVYADRRAIEYYARAYARLESTLDERGAVIALRLGKLFERTGELERAGSWYQAAADGARGRQPRFELEATLGLASVALLTDVVPDADLHATAAARLFALMPSPPDKALQAVVQRLQALVAFRRGESAHAEALFLEALAAFEAVEAEPQAVEVLLDLSRLVRHRGDLFHAVRYARRALQRARSLGDSAAMAEASTLLGRGLLRAGRLASARRVLLRASRLARSVGDRRREAAVLRQLGNLRLRQGEVGAALERYVRALELARDVRASVEEAACLRDIGVARGRLGEYRAAVIALRAAREVAVVVGDPHGAVHAGVDLAYAYAQVGAFERAAAVLEELAGAVEVGDAALDIEGQAVAAYVALMQGEPRLARGIVGFVLDRLAVIEDAGSRAAALFFAALCSVRLGAAETAQRVCDRLTREVADNGLRDFLPVSRLVAGETALALGERDCAEGLLVEAASLAAHGGLRPVEIEARARLGELFAKSERGAREATRAMELMRDVARGLPPELVGCYLRRGEARALRDLFAREQERLLGAPLPATRELKV